jgi:hypothetical protein
MAAKFVQFIDAADDAATYPADSLLGMTCASDGALLVKFASSIGGGTGAEHDSIALTITADTEKTVMKSIGEAIAFSKQAVLVIADDVASEYVDANITACAITLDT